MLFPHTKFMMHLTADRGPAAHHVRPAEGLGFPTAAWRGLNGYFITKTSLLLFNISETAFNLWKQVLLRRLFTYGYHDNMREQQLRLENASIRFCLYFVAKNNVYITMPIYHIMFNLWERCISFMKKGLITKFFTYGCHDSTQGQHTRATNKGIKPNTLCYALCG